ncbi:MULTISPECIES: hypothetical protein [unclassified Pseudomonas]|nr:hypothetical protein [uncultured Pseudomonas sp.]
MEKLLKKKVGIAACCKLRRDKREGVPTGGKDLFGRGMQDV